MCYIIISFQAFVLLHIHSFVRNSKYNKTTTDFYLERLFLFSISIRMTNKIFTFPFPRPFKLKLTEFITTGQNNYSHTSETYSFSLIWCFSVFSMVSEISIPTIRIGAKVSYSRQLPNVVTKVCGLKEQLTL